MSRYVKDANGVWHAVAGLEAIDSTPTQGSTAAVSSGGVYASEQTIKQALTTVVRTGTSNSGTKIESGTFFCLNGNLAQAINEIDNGAIFTLNTNYRAISSGNGALNDLLLKKFTFTYSSDAILANGHTGFTPTNASSIPEGYTPVAMIALSTGNVNVVIRNINVGTGGLDLKNHLDSQVNVTPAMDVLLIKTSSLS